ncbi:MAG TPA: cupin domain-containing protein [Chloroflexota bacterium]
MAYAGQTIGNPITGEQITFLETTDDTRGERLLFDCLVRPDGIRLPPHVHSRQEERLEVLAGTLGVMRGDKVYTLRPGHKVVLPRRIKHQWWNAGRNEMKMRVQVTPPRHLEVVLEAMSVMAHEGKLRENALPSSPFDLVHLLKLSETYTPQVPIWIQRIALALGVSIGWLLGYDPDLKQYRSDSYEPLRMERDRPNAA